MKFLLISSSGQASCLDSIKKELTARGHTFKHVIDCKPYEQLVGLVTLHKENYDSVIITDFKFKKFARCPGMKAPLVSTIHHGIGLKIKANYLDGYFASNPVDVVFVSGQIYFETLSMPGSPTRQVYVTGFPKTDYLVNNQTKQSEFKERLRKKYGFDGRPIILYAPTWSRHEKSYGTLQSFREIYQQLGTDYNILLAPHPSDLLWLKGQEDLIKLPGVKYYFEVNKNPAILGADLILSDNSSIAVESSAINKPIVHIVNKTMPDTMCLFMDAKERAVRFGEVISLPEQLSSLKEVVQKTLRAEYDSAEKDYWRMKFTYGCDGQATNRVLNILETLIRRQI